MTGTNAEKAHYKRIQRAKRVAEGMVRVDCWFSPDEIAIVDARDGTRADSVRAIVAGSKLRDDAMRLEGVYATLEAMQRPKPGL